MKNTSKKLGVILLTSALLFSQSAFAARMGKSSNLGMQRSNTTSQSNYQPSANTATGAAQPQKQGLGVGSVVAGAAAGAVGGYLLGKAMNSNESSTASQSSGSSIPWGVIGILGMLLVIGLMIFRRKTTPATNSANFNGSAPTNNGFQIPNIRRDNANFNNAAQTQNTGNAPQAANNQNMERMADGVEAQFFLRQAKGMFLHIQSMNTPENVSEVAKYMTPALYAEMKSLITENDYVADFSQLDCQYLQSTIENGQYVASAKFFGKVSESPNSPVVDFSEIWHFVKPTGIDGAKWLVAGIQQVSTAN